MVNIFAIKVLTQASETSSLVARNGESQKDVQSVHKVLLKQDSNGPERSEFGLLILDETELGVEMAQQVVHLALELHSSQFDAVVQEDARGARAMRLHIKQAVDELFDENEQLRALWHLFAQYLQTVDQPSALTVERNFETFESQLTLLRSLTAPSMMLESALVSFCLMTPSCSNCLSLWICSSGTSL